MSKIDELCELLKDEPINEHAAVLCYESGRVLEHATYLTWAQRHGGTDETDIRIIRGKLKSELIDVLAQAWSLAIKVKEDPNELLEMGCEKAIEAITLKISGKLNQHIEGKW